MLLVHTFSVLSLQLKKLRRLNESAIDLSNASPAYGHKKVRRSTRYSNQQGSKSRPTSYWVQLLENNRNVSASRQCLLVRITALFQNLRYKLQGKLCHVVPMHQNPEKSNSKTFSGVSEGYTITSYARLYKQWHRPISKRFRTRILLVRRTYL